MISVENTTKSYSGRTGCMCGCNGNYNTSERARKSAITALLKHPDVKLYVWLNESKGCLSVETESRIRAVYLNAQGVEQAAKLVKKVGA
jgi:neutral trehalase